MSALLLASLVLSPPALVDQVRTNLGYDTPMTLDLLVSGTGTRASVPGPFRLRLSPSGRFVYSLQCVLGDTIGFDGKNVWEADRSGATRLLAFGDEDRNLTQAMLVTGSWLDKGAPVDITERGDSELIVHRKGSEFKPVVTIDRTTHIPVKATYVSEAGPVEIDFGNWRKESGRQIPHTISMEEGGVTDTIHIENVSTAAAASSGYSMPTWIASDVAFAPGQSPEVETKRLPSGHIIVHPLINGKDVGWFIFDSGAEAMCIDKGAADELKLPAIGKAPVVGVGGLVTSPFRTGGEITLGPATVKNLTFLELDLAPISKMLNRKLGGIIGYDVFRRMIVEMDVQKPQVSVFDPASFSLSKGSWQPIRFDGGDIGVQASFEGHNGWFRLDTGASDTVSFHTPFVQKFNLLEGRTLTAVRQAGVGGLVDSKSGTIQDFELAGHRFEKPSVTFSMSPVGAMANRWLIGNIGQQFMNPFTLVFDYPSSRMAFVENSSH